MEVPAVVVTGSATRIGRSIARRLHREGYRVVVHCRNSVDDAESLAAELNSVRSNSAVVCRADLTNSGALATRCEEVIGACVSAFGRCDVLVNNASAFYPTPLLPKDDDVDNDLKLIERQTAELFGSNAVGPFYLTRSFARAAKRAAPSCDGHSRVIINLCDSLVNQPCMGFCLYNMGKHALIGLTKSAALELAPHGIRVNGVSPGVCLLPEKMEEDKKNEWRRKIPLGQQEASAEQIADAVLFLVSGSAEYITGAILNVDGGLSLVHA
uniref:Putative pteridine reductase n=1 Tax=Trypanosoma congolense (strain IL3000) TaxID=1068625 RepID=G0URJ0_TRYCI|nr:putative pteridine reductase [Trypanosoma congolense IL3000]